MFLSTISSHNATNSASLRPLINASACWRPSVTSSAFSAPVIRNFICFHTTGSISDNLRYRFLARPIAKTINDDPWMSVLSTSKNAAAPASCGIAGSGGVSRDIPAAVNDPDTESSPEVNSLRSKSKSSATAFAAAASPACCWVWLSMGGSAMSSKKRRKLPRELDQAARKSSGRWCQCGSSGDMART